MSGAHDTALLAETLAHARALLIRHRTAHGAFCGQLSSSALSTATASMAFALSARAGVARGAPRQDHQQLADRGHDWLCAHQNADGGWGDTTDSPTNISTTTLCWASLRCAEDAPVAKAAATRAEAWLAEACGDLTPAALATAIRARYGRDHTFSVPILTTCALAGRLGEDGWKLVPSLPFELAACPHQWFRWLQLRTVSYALPALIALGQARHHHRPTGNPALRGLRQLARRRTLRVLSEIQPNSGGFLEAAPLTSFVAMSLISIGLDDHPVVGRGLGFLADTVRDDGSWPIDTNLDTWTTTLATVALGDEARADTCDWLLRQQYREEHPYTHAPPGGWAWTDLSGGVPDADDTAGALLALHLLAAGVPDRAPLVDAAAAGIRWLLDLQNRDGGIPTFCRGWGKLPFDRSSPDLTAHAVRACAAWRDVLPTALARRAGHATRAAIRYLLRVQRRDGAWVPLWFGNQYEPEQENPLYGTSRVLQTIAAVRATPSIDAAWTDAGARGAQWLLAAQQSDGGFAPHPSAQPSVEETAVAVDALAQWASAAASGLPEAAVPPDTRTAVARGAVWLAARTAGGTRFEPAPIGLYFAKLWYSEQLYPVIFTVSALQSAQRCLALRSHPAVPGSSDPCQTA